MNVLLLEPYDGGSHRAFARGWAARSRHAIEIWALPARFWKWRLRGAAFAFAEKWQRRSGMSAAVPFDVVVATSLMNAAEFAAAVRLRLPLLVYVHENQLSYPRPADEPIDHGLALASIASAAAADRLLFNSGFHRKAFFEGLERWLARFPDRRPSDTARAIRRKSGVASPGIDWASLAPMAKRRARTGASSVSLSCGPRSSGPRARNRDVRGSAPLILWNHRWEFDKNAPAFFWALELVLKRGRDFRVALLGESSQLVPKPFLEARDRLGDRIVRYGFVRSEKAYRAWLGRADIVVSTAQQENFGLAVVEAIAAGAFPLLPSRLSYPEILPARYHSDCLYRSQADLVKRLDRLLASPDSLERHRAARSRAMRRYDWAGAASALDTEVEALVRDRRR